MVKEKNPSSFPMLRYVVPVHRMMTVRKVQVQRVKLGLKGGIV